jgi:predicted transcriptional regulator
LANNRDITGVEGATIRLGGMDFAVRPLTLRQLRTVLPAFARAGAVGAEDGVDAAIDILAAALSRDHPEITRDALLDTEASVRELAEAVTTVARLSGLVAPGEAVAGSVP